MRRVRVVKNVAGDHDGVAFSFIANTELDLADDLATRLINGSKAIPLDATITTVAAGAGDVQAVTGPATLIGYSIREAAGVAGAATVILRDGTADTAPQRVLIELPADGSQSTSLPRLDFADGIYVDRVAGTTELFLYLL